MDKFLQQFLMFFAASADGGDQAAGGSSNTDGDDTSSENDSSSEPQTEPSDDETLGENGKKALQAERDARKKAERRAADLEAQIEQSGSTHQAELEQAQEQNQQLQHDLAQSQAEALRYRVAARFGINTEPGQAEDGSETPSDAEMFLTGATEEELLSQAQRLSSLRKAALDDGLVDPTQGGSGKPAPPSNAEQFAQQLEDF